MYSGLNLSISLFKTGFSISWSGLPDIIEEAINLETVTDFYWFLVA